MKTLAAALLLAASAAAAFAQTNPLRRPAATPTPAATTAQPSTSTAATAPATTPDEPKTKAKGRAKSTGVFAERRKRCSAEWANAKSANATNGQKWPQFWSACNTRLKAAGV
ncbi:hypothetical protein [Terrarubrum flagellatum]|uniref:hypothetical protein n=1 Tax=Terrirubrum flagellatum TaxID=2895980 RepID=UPI0031455C03